MALLEIEDQIAFNIERWDALCADSTLAKLDFRVETDRFGQIIMTPPPAPEHGMSQFDIGMEIQKHLADGRVITECPISTEAGVKVADTAWISKSRLAVARSRSLLTSAPEICVEVLSPSNTKQEIEEKKRLYFVSGADEVWVCAMDGTLSFFLKSDPAAPAASALCPDFPKTIQEDESA